jgi:hypothetical protein
MTPEEKFELLDKYLTDRLGDDERKAFEQTVKSDPDLQAELAFQREVVEGIRYARKAELKAMLNQVPVPPVHTFYNTVAAKVIASLIFVGTVGLAVYFATSDRQPEPVVQENEMPVNQTEEPQPDEPGVSSPEPVETEERTDSAQPLLRESKSSRSTQPTNEIPGRVEVFTPNDEELKEQMQREREHLANIEKGFVTSSTEVELNSSLKGFRFHYAFKNNKLVLYGNFEDQLYEILEFISDKGKTIVLFYKGKYYLLDTAQTEPYPLVVIRNKELLNQLKKYRSR